MKYLDQAWRLRKVLCFALAVFAPVTTQAQSKADNSELKPAQLAEVIADLRARRVQPEKVLALKSAGFQLIASGRYADAWSIFSAILEALPRDQQASYGGALALFNLKQLRQAEELARSAVAFAKDDITQAPMQNAANWRRRQSDSLVLLAVILAVEKDNTGALKAVRDATDLAPDSFDAQFALGRALYGAGDPANAALAFQKAIALKPEDSQARFFLATALEGAGNFDKAREAYGELIRLQPQSAEGHLGLGVLLLKLDAAHTEQGVSELLKAIALKGDLYEARITLGRVLVKSGRSAEAIEHFSQAAKLAPNNPEPHYQLAIAYRRLGKTIEAERESAKVKEINSSRRNTSQTKPAADNKN